MYWKTAESTAVVISLVYTIWEAQKIYPDEQPSEAQCKRCANLGVTMKELIYAY